MACLRLERVFDGARVYRAGRAPLARLARDECLGLVRVQPVSRIRDRREAGLRKERSEARPIVGEM